jgi:hypothetical protein
VADDRLLETGDQPTLIGELCHFEFESARHFWGRSRLAKGPASRPVAEAMPRMAAAGPRRDRPRKVGITTTR